MICSNCFQHVVSIQFEIQIAEHQGLKALTSLLLYMQVSGNFWGSSLMFRTNRVVEIFWTDKHEFFFAFACLTILAQSLLCRPLRYSRFLDKNYQQSRLMARHVGFTFHDDWEQISAIHGSRKFITLSGCADPRVSHMNSALDVTILLHECIFLNFTRYIGWFKKRFSMLSFQWWN
jgi:predicted amidophosphoribosyltransferase